MSKQLIARIAARRSSTSVRLDPGLAARSARDDTLYVCVDLDPDKLQRFVRRHRGARAMVGDATRCPIRTGADAVMAVKVTHHLDDAQLAAMVGEAARIVRPGGR